MSGGTNSTTIKEATSQGLRSPIRWYGAKGKLAPRIVNLLPAHERYVEVFGGGASVLFAKAPAPVEVYNDVNQDLVRFMRVLADPEQFPQFHRGACLTQYSRKEYEFCRDTWRDCQDPVERARRWYVLARQSHNGHHGEGWASSISSSTCGMADVVNSWIKGLIALPAVHQRLRGVVIECDDFRAILDRYDEPGTLFYLDPPYVLSTRRGGPRYKAELSDYDHMQLVERLLQLRARAVVSGYAHGIYEPLERAGWERIDIPWTAAAAGRTKGTGLLGKGAIKGKQDRIETIWIGP